MKRFLSLILVLIFAFAFCLPVLADSEMPYWYYQGDFSQFTDFHGENLRRVVDDADIFSDEQEAVLNTRMNEVIEKLGIGYVLFTDDDNHGLSPEEYSSDFLHFGGYGVGDGYGAVVFYLCFDPSNRCWRTTSINSYESIFTASVTYDIDETVDADIRAGRYYEAFLKHIDFVENLFSRTVDNLADWYPEEVTNTTLINRDDREFSSSTSFLTNPRIVDNYGIFSKDTANKISDKLFALSRKYDADFVVFTDGMYNTLRRSEYADDFYYYNGYCKDGIILYILNDVAQDTVYYGTICYGKYYDKFFDIRNTFIDAAEEGIDDSDYDKALTDFTKRLEFVLKHGREPMETKSKVMCIVIALIAGLIVGGIHLAKCRKGMKVVSPVDAREYLVENSFVLRDKKVYYLYSTVTKTAKPKSSSSSGGGSSYSSGSSSGGSYSSGGRSF